VKSLTLVTEADHHPSLHVDFGKFLPKLASYVNYLFASPDRLFYLLIQLVRAANCGQWCPWWNPIIAVKLIRHILLKNLGSMLSMELLTGYWGPFKNPQDNESRRKTTKDGEIRRIML